MSTEVRPLDLIIDATLKLIPADYEKRDFLENEFDKIKEDFSKATPKELGSLWWRFTHYLATTLGEPDVAWKNEIADMLQGTKNYEDVLNA